MAKHQQPPAIPSHGDHASSPGQGRRIYIIGDSIGKGVIQDRESGRYRLMDEPLLPPEACGPSAEVINYSHFGYTLTRGRVQIERLLKRTLPPEMMLLEYGGNDCDFDWPAIAADPAADHEPNTPLQRFTALYSELIERLRSVQIKPVLLNLPPLDPKRYFRTLVGRGNSAKALLRWLGDIPRIYRFQELYSHAIERIASNLGVDLIDVRSDFLEAPDFPELIGDDGIHPTERGYRMMGRRVSRYLNASLGLAPQPQG